LLRKGNRVVSDPAAFDIQAPCQVTERIYLVKAESYFEWPLACRPRLLIIAASHKNAASG
jgi:hypothetical protein